MPQRQFWEIIVDDEARTYEVVGLSSDGTEIADLVGDMQDLDTRVRFETLPSSASQANIDRCYKEAGYRKENGLRERLLQEYQARKAKQ
jgi:hypothetical protein